MKPRIDIINFNSYFNKILSRLKYKQTVTNKSLEAKPRVIPKQELKKRFKEDII